MNSTFTAEQQELVNTVTAFLEKRSPEPEVRRLMDAGGAPDPSVWTQMAQQLGLQGLLVPEEYGGVGSGFVDLGLVLEKMGAVLLVAPFLSSALAASALVWSDNDADKQHYLPGVASGEKIGALALAEDSGRWDADAVTTRSIPDGDGHRLTGTKMFVVDGQLADFFVVAARTPDDEVGLFVVDSDTTGVTTTALKTLDMTRPQARVEFVDAPARGLSLAADRRGLFDRVLAGAGIALAAEQVGGAQRCLDMAVGYAKVRVQFGKPIGSFQAIKHKCADMLLAVESARSAAYYAARVLDEGGVEVAAASALAQACCSDAFTKVAAENIQIHGGIGFTWEHPAHLYFKRAKSSEILFGEPATQRERLAQLVGI